MVSINHDVSEIDSKLVKEAAEHDTCQLSGAIFRFNIDWLDHAMDVDNNIQGADHAQDCPVGLRE